MKDAKEALDRLRWHERRLFDAVIHYEDEHGRTTTLRGADVQSLDPDVILVRMPGRPIKIRYDRVSRIDLAGGLYWLPPSRAVASRTGPTRS